MSLAPPDVWTRQLTIAEDAALGIGAGRHSFHLLHTGGMESCVDHPGWDSSWPTPTEHDIDDLVEQALVRLDAPMGGKNRSFSLTTQGRLHGMRAREARIVTRSLPASLEWAGLEPVLEAAITAYEQAGLPQGGLPLAHVPMPPGAPHEAAVELVRAGLLIDCDVEGGGTSGVDQIPGPTFVRPSSQALQLKRGWPQGAATAAIELCLATGKGKPWPRHQRRTHYGAIMPMRVLCQHAAGS
jgi:hypothetical protein